MMLFIFNYRTFSKNKNFIGGENGFIPGAQLIFKSRQRHGDYHGEMNRELFLKWLREKLLPNLPSRSVVIMDNAPYHSIILNKPPNSSTRKQIIKDWLTSCGIPFLESHRVAELLQLVKLNQEPVCYEVDEIVAENGHIVLRFPPYHCDLNPIEYAWNEVKHFVKARNTTHKMGDIIDLVHGGFGTISIQHWGNYCQHIKKTRNGILGARSPF